MDEKLQFILIQTRKNIRQIKEGSILPMSEQGRERTYTFMLILPEHHSTFIGLNRQ